MKIVTSSSIKRLVALLGVRSHQRFGSNSPGAGKPTIPIIVKDTTSFFWQIVFSGARKAAKS